MPGGYIRDALDMKFFILYVLGHFGMPVRREDVYNCVLVDEGANYFMFCDSLEELIGLGHVSCGEDGLITITDFGRENYRLYENRLPASIRHKALHAAMKTVSQIRRSACIGCETEKLGEDRYRTTLAMSDGEEEIFNLSMLTASAQQSALLENNFRARAEEIYNEILAALLSGRNEG